MDRPPSRSLDSPRQSRRREKTPSVSETLHPSQPGHVSGSTSTSLPPIRALHPNLPPPNTNQYFGPSDHSAYQPSFEHPPPSGHIRYGTQHVPHDPTKALETIEESDSDKHSSPPPKKRRKRQALSCTECKRRKIKCDRIQPCGPCARRGEQDKCQWHQVETKGFRSDKYVTRAEYDQLKGRVDQLEYILSRITGAGNVPMHPTMVPAPAMAPGTGHPNPPYSHHVRSTSGSYGLGPEYSSDPYSVNTRPPVTALPSSSRTTISGEINPPATEREIPSSRPYAVPHRPASRQFRHTLGPATAAPSYGSTDGTDERPKKLSAWTQQGMRPRQSCRAVDLVRQPQLYSTLLPSLFLLVCLLRLIIRNLLPPVPPPSFRWKSPQRTLPTAAPIRREAYGSVAAHSPRWSSPLNNLEMAGLRCNPLPPLVTNDPCQTPETRPPSFFGLGSIIRLACLA
ncbi:hypothetical protein BJ322DRAFT_789022 [Thelephora terrestris]|uniref:Zn(2)-C6 fungal-type domain-containing protein n=1 Tax=Thelephora terrestris TaxID=56493 RepID=A0A9P6HHT0_9AGAM|nr:hypothetical protein BJ322DRAFT_789022 [Thelephora terrestris]